MTISTRLTKLLAIDHPIILAPMAGVSGGVLAAAVSAAGGLGLIGGGYGDHNWLQTEFDAAGNERVGVGFITWSLAEQPKLLDWTLTRKPTAVMLTSSMDTFSLLLCFDITSLAHCDVVRGERHPPHLWANFDEHKIYKSLHHVDNSSMWMHYAIAC